MITGTAMSEPRGKRQRACRLYRFQLEAKHIKSLQFKHLLACAAYAAFKGESARFHFVAFLVGLRMQLAADFLTYFLRGTRDTTDTSQRFLGENAIRFVWRSGCEAAHGSARSCGGSEAAPPGESKSLGRSGWRPRAKLARINPYKKGFHHG